MHSETSVKGGVVFLPGGGVLKFWWSDIWATVKLLRSEKVAGMWFVTVASVFD